MSAFVYILTNKMGGTLYTGSTTDIARRISEHRAKTVSDFTKTYFLVRLVHVEEYDTIISARHREWQIKNWHRAWKIALIEGSNPDWNDLTPLL